MDRCLFRAPCSELKTLESTCEMLIKSKMCAVEIWEFMKV
jgi:hypothetical protein